MKGIMFTEPMFNAVIEGRKTQTRRIVKPQPDTIRSITKKIADKPDYEISEKVLTPEPAYHFLMSEKKFIKPRYKVGEKVYIKEPYKFTSPSVCELAFDFKFSNEIIEFDYHIIDNNAAEVDYQIRKFQRLQEKSKTGYINKLFVPKWLQKYFPHKIEITAAPCERLQDISYEDCLKEGIFYNGITLKGMGLWSNGYKHDYPNPKQAYAALIDSINGKGTWDSNPYVWVYSFKLTINN